jgi:hypothetical protein
MLGLCSQMRQIIFDPSGQLSASGGSYAWFLSVGKLLGRWHWWGRDLEQTPQMTIFRAASRDRGR